MLVAQMTRWLNEGFLAGLRVGQPYDSQLLGDLRGYPTLHINEGSLARIESLQLLISNGLLCYLELALFPSDSSPITFVDWSFRSACANDVGAELEAREISFSSATIPASSTHSIFTTGGQVRLVTDGEALAAYQGSWG
jgi:hypothetical protein